MKKTIVVLAIIISILTLNKKEEEIIPKESIRFRVIANSNNKQDQLIKKKVVNNISKELIKTNDISNIEDTRKYIINNLPTFENIVDLTLKENKIDSSFSINYGKNYFPKKVYKKKVYKEGEYESLVIKLGEGTGNNFWCVLFPPLCFSDEKVEYKSFIKEVIESIFSKN